MDKNVIASEISEKTTIYNNTCVRNSNLDDFSLVADGATLLNSSLGVHTEAGRYSYLQDSKIADYTYLGHHTTIIGSTIGRFCSISWNVSIGGQQHDYNCPSMLTNYWWNRFFGGGGWPLTEKKRPTIAI